MIYWFPYSYQPSFMSKKLHIKKKKIKTPVLISRKCIKLLPMMDSAKQFQKTSHRFYLRMTTIFHPFCPPQQNMKPGTAVILESLTSAPNHSLVGDFKCLVSRS